MISPSRLASALTLASGLAVAISVAAVGCGPKQKFCPDAGDGVCVVPMDAPVVDLADAPSDAPQESIYVGNDAATE